MTPAARYSSAIDILDEILVGVSAEKCLTSWARANRYAGSQDRAAVRDHVYAVLRRKRSLGALGGGLSGRLLIVGLIRHQDIDPNDIFGTGGYGPAALTDDEKAGGVDPTDAAQMFDIPDWLWPIWEADLGPAAQNAARALQDRGPVTLRVNLRRGSREDAMLILAEDKIETIPLSDVKTALQVVENERRIRQSRAYIGGLVDLQDLASQDAVTGLMVADGARVLDYCAGGGGKSLALADAFHCSVTAHDISAARMGDIPVRAARAGTNINVVETRDLAGQLFDLVFVDAPCSGSGTWRRAPEAKWALTSAKLFNYKELQLDVLRSSAAYVRRGGQLVYATCSVLKSENDDVLARFMIESSEFQLETKKQRLPDGIGDGFFHAVLRRI